MVGISTGVLAATGNPVEVVTPDGPTKAAALELISTPSSSGAGPLVNIAVAVVPVATGPRELQTHIGEATRVLEPSCGQPRPVESRLRPFYAIIRDERLSAQHGQALPTAVGAQRGMPPPLNAREFKFFGSPVASPRPSL